MFPFSLISIFRLRRYYVELKALQPPYWVRFGDCMCQVISPLLCIFPDILAWCLQRSPTHSPLVRIASCFFALTF